MEPVLNPVNSKNVCVVGGHPMNIFGNFLFNLFRSYWDFSLMVQTNTQAKTCDPLQPPTCPLPTPRKSTGSDSSHWEEPAQHKHIIEVDRQFLFSPNSQPSSFCISDFNTLDKQLSSRGGRELRPQGGRRGGGKCVCVSRERVMPSSIGKSISLSKLSTRIWLICKLRRWVSGR